MSARHCTLFATPRGIEIADQGSKNGVFVGGARVTRAALPAAGGAFVIGRTTVSIKREREEEQVAPGAEIPGLVGSSLAMHRVAAAIRRHARLRAPILLQGESGTGKDVVAQALHRLSGRSGAYVPINVGALSESLADAELFGHRRGAFTGAVAARAGAFEQAQRGTLFLDEIAELAPSLQVKLLRVVEDGIVRPLGASQALRVEVRLVSASWAELAERCAQSRFRADLYHRLSMVEIRLPPLRQRKSDIPALAAALLARYEAEVGDKRLSSAALAALVDYAWPGNVRELGAVLYRAAVASEGSRIDVAHIGLQALDRRAGQARVLGPGEVIALYDRHGGNVTAAARAAHVPRSTFRSWLDKARGASGGAA